MVAERRFFLGNCVAATQFPSDQISCDTGPPTHKYPVPGTRYLYSQLLRESLRDPYCTYIHMHLTAIFGCLLVLSSLWSWYSYDHDVYWLTSLSSVSRWSIGLQKHEKRGTYFQHKRARDTNPDQHQVSLHDSHILLHNWYGSNWSMSNKRPSCARIVVVTT